jgi:hypothetical protein
MRCAIILCLVFARVLFAGPHDSLQSGNLDLYLDCRECDANYVRSEVSFVNYVRDPAQADVHCMVARQLTGGGGQEFTLVFIGKRRFSGQNDTLVWTSKKADSDDIIRTGLARVLTSGLMRYVVHTPVAEFLSVAYTKPRRSQNPPTRGMPGYSVRISAAISRDNKSGTR